MVLAANPSPSSPPPSAITRIYEVMRAFLLKKTDSPWEVVDHKVVQSVPTFYEDEGK